MLQDDLESLAYTLLEMCHGGLPWCLTAGKEFEEGHDWYSARQLHGMAVERIEVGPRASPCLRACSYMTWQWSMHVGVSPDLHAPQPHHLLTTDMPGAEQLHGQSLNSRWALPCSTSANCPSTTTCPLPCLMPKSMRLRCI